MAKFKKGQSGNPSGRTPMPPELKEALKAACPAAVDTLREIINDPNARDSDRIRAAEVILDRAYGKPAQSVELEAEIGPETRGSIEGMSMRQRGELLRKAVEAYAEASQAEQGDT